MATFHEIEFATKRDHANGMIRLQGAQKMKNQPASRTSRRKLGTSIAAEQTNRMKCGTRSREKMTKKKLDTRFNEPRIPRARKINN